MYQIEKGIQVPRNRVVAGRIYPFDKMHIGDSFLASDKTVTQLRGAVQGFRRAHGKRLKFFVTETKGGPRVWRVK